MKLPVAARDLIGAGANATLVTLNEDGSPQVSLVWVALRSDGDDDELVCGHFGEHRKVRNVRRDGRVALTVVSADNDGLMQHYLSVAGTARIEEGGAPELLAELAATLAPDSGFPPADAPPGWLTRIRVDRIGGIGPWFD